MDTNEVFFSSKRQSFLQEQGYSYEVVRDCPPKDAKNLIFESIEDQKQLLLDVVSTDDTEGDIECIDEDAPIHLTETVRKIGSLNSFSGSVGQVYFEFEN